jgi:hypothetical protein
METPSIYLRSSGATNAHICVHLSTAAASMQAESVKSGGLEMFNGFSSVQSGSTTWRGRQLRQGRGIERCDALPCIFLMGASCCCCRSCCDCCCCFCCCCCCCCCCFCCCWAKYFTRAL